MLYVVGTPIGNLGDFSPRAVETLKEVDFIAAEDTRVTVKLLNHFEISKPMVSYYAHNLKEKSMEIINRILAGETCAIVSDAGMPCISDPGELLVELAGQNNIKVCVIPGPSAVISALCISGLKTTRFTFEGFLSVNKRNRKEHLSSLVNEQRTMIFYEAPHKLKTTLLDMYEYLGDRKISLARELTKIYEEVIRTTLTQAIEYYNGELSPKGEYVLVLEGAIPVESDDITDEELTSIIQEKKKQGKKTKEIVKELIDISDKSKNELYNFIVNLE